MTFFDEYTINAVPERQARLKSILSKRHVYKYFKLDTAASKWLDQNLTDLKDMIENQTEFAKPPFPNVAIEIMMHAKNIEPTPVLILWGDDKTMNALMEVESSVKLAMLLPIDFKCDFDKMSFQTEFARTHSKDVTEALREHIRRLSGISVLFFLMMHKPKVLQISDKPHRTAIVKGKRRVYLAHSQVTIDLLAADDAMQRNVATGARGGYRAHEVRGTWVNYDRVTTCDHQWKEMETSSEEIPRYMCEKCWQRRSWRKSHQRGDASLGFVRKTYNVTAKGMQQ